ncbi:helix-turn-helix domain-containing protein [Chitinispirillales bacterium ANBcel5]|uniref:AraC family transcriptional regulator n=1 Tax=Cellulosispirillum alkaliphilum TaxID=3039283 RepID=UPI002A53AED8|nr:helix-turn-helix domain-containing protein [Chitinispirillales bacterium ANBcel5]
MYKPIQYFKSSSPDSRVKYSEYAPFSCLSEFVVCYWSVTSKGPVANLPHRILPDGCIDIIFDLENKLSFISGISKETARLYLNGTISFLGIRFHPGSIVHLLEDKASVYLNNGFETRYSSVVIRDMADRVLNADSPGEAVQIIDRELIRFFSSYQKKGQFSTLLEHSLFSKGCISVKDLSFYHGLSERHISRLFNENVGLSTKNFLRIVRFQNALKYLNSGLPTLDISFDLGYFDQSHLLKEMKRYLGEELNSRV